MKYPLLVFSHLRWNFVFQRPQHLLSRLARQRRVLFIEEPMASEGNEPHWELREEAGVTVCCPHTPLTGPPGYCDQQQPYLAALLGELLERQQLESYVTWFYTPMALPLLDRLEPKAVIYDCMDELSQFRGAPREMLQRERELMSQADVVFTGGPSLYQAKKERHSHVRCFPSSVDAAHFGQASQALAEPEDQRALPHPRLGFFGVIDERFDADLVAQVAEARPEWQLVMVGPVVKIDPASLPQRENIHYTGQRTYEQLPAYLSGWDVCLLPFARNESTEFISPTKTLEYMAAEKPIVSTPITDVAQPYGGIVYLGSTAEEFITACEHALNDPPQEKLARLAGMRKVLQQTSWDKTATAMDQEIEAAIARREQTQSKSRSNEPQAADTQASDDSEESAPVVVIGAGPTGLSAAYHLGEQGLLLERSKQIGGLCRSIHDRGFTYDLAGHIMFSKDPYVHKMYEMLLGDNVHWQDREAWIFSQGVYTRYPFQGCLYGLPTDVIVECILGAIEARFGPLTEDAPVEDTVSQAAARSGGGQKASAKGNDHARSGSNGHSATSGKNAATANGAKEANGASNGHSRPNGQLAAQQKSAAQSADGQNASNGQKACDAKSLEDCCGDGILESEAPLVAARSAGGGPQRSQPRNFEEFIYQVWGKGIAKHFAIPYNRKLWAVPLTEMETSWLGGRVPMPDLEEMIRYSLTPAAKPMGPNARFGYPLRGGFQALMEGFLPHLNDRLITEAAVERVSPSEHLLTLRDGRQFPYEVLISTMPLPVLIRSMGDEAPREVCEAVERLRYVSVRCVHLGIGREKLTEKHWIYYPEDTVFHRIFVQGNASPHVNPPGGFGLTCEITYSPDKPLPCDGQDLIDRCIADCHTVGIFNPEDEVWSALQVDMPFAYVVYDHQRSENVQIIRDWLSEQDILLAGRYSEWEYYNSDHAFIAGRNAAEAALQRLNRAEWEITTADHTRAVANRS